VGFITDTNASLPDQHKSLACRDRQGEPLTSGRGEPARKLVACPTWSCTRAITPSIAPSARDSSRLRASDDWVAKHRTLQRENQRLRSHDSSRTPAWLPGRLNLWLARRGCAIWAHSHAFVAINWSGTRIQGTCRSGPRMSRTTVLRRPGGANTGDSQRLFGTGLAALCSR
jgi:hypothetical protein